MYLDKYLEYIITEKKYSTHTVDAYRCDINSFVQFQKTLHPEFSLTTDMNYQLARSWVVSLVEKKLAKRTINRKIVALRRFYQYLLIQGVVSENPFDDIAALKTEKLLSVFVSEKEINSITDLITFEDNFEAQRDKLIIEMLYCTGIRRAELINMRETDIDIDAKTVKVTGKRNKQRLIPFPESLIALIKNYLHHKKNLAFTNPYLILTKKGEKAYPALLYRIVKKNLTLITNVKKRSPHVLRHTYATHLLNNGADINVIKELLGHANLSATQIYTHNTFKQLNKVYKQAHPRA